MHNDKRCLMPYYVYVLLCKDGSYYTGCTKNLKSRIRRHIKGLGARYTRIHKPEKIVYVEKYPTLREAMHREKTIKKLSHKKKQELVNP